MRAFGPAAKAVEARSTRLLTRLIALNQRGWEESLDRDAQGPSFFVPSKSAAAFAYVKETGFCLTGPCEKNSVAIDAEDIDELSAQAILNFLAKLYPSLPGSSHFQNKLALAGLWTAFESAYKIIGNDVFKIHLPAMFSPNLTISECSDFYLTGADLHFHFVISGSCMIAIASRRVLLPHISCSWLSLPLPLT